MNKTKSELAEAIDRSNDLLEERTAVRLRRIALLTGITDSALQLQTKTAELREMAAQEELDYGEMCDQLQADVERIKTQDCTHIRHEYRYASVHTAQRC